ncbi:MAG: hypothetical protein ABJA34_11470 [Pseudonocardiales bacterium]
MTDPPGRGWANPAWGEPAGPSLGAPRGPTLPSLPGYGPYAQVANPAPAPGAVPLRPLGIGEMLDGALSIIRRHPRITIGLAALIVTVQQAISVIARVSTGSVGGTFVPGANLTALTNPFDSAVGLALTLLNLVLGTVLGAILTGMLMIVVGESVVGRQVDLGQVWRRVRPRFWALLGGSLLAGLLPWAGVVLAVAAGLALGLLVNSVAGVVLGSVLGLALLVFPGAYLWGVLALTTPAITLEQLGPLQGLRRSWRLARPDFWRVWGTRALSTLIGSFLTAIIATPFAVVGTIFLASGGIESEPAGWREAVFLVLTAIGGIVAGSVVQPYLSGVIGLLYVDRRMRGEGLDIALQENARADRLPQSMPGGSA